MTNTESEKTLRRKKILWRATHRGMKEMDLMLGGYAQSNLAQMDTHEMDQFEEILEISDAQLTDWITGKTPTPDYVQTKMFAEIKAQTFATIDYKKL